MSISKFSPSACGAVPHPLYLANLEISTGDRQLDAAKIRDKAVNPVSRPLVRVRVVSLVPKELVSPDRHVALFRELIIRRLPVCHLEDL